MSHAISLVAGFIDRPMYLCIMTLTEPTFNKQQAFSCEFIPVGKPTETTYFPGFTSSEKKP